MSRFRLIFCILIVSLFFVFPGIVKAASLYLSPSTGAYTVGNTFLVQVRINSAGYSINAADGTLVFDPDKLEVVSVSKTNSVFSLWVQDPEYSNAVGTIEFAGGKPSPGYTGASGVVINITFKTKISGTANLTFASGSILADDGKGTNVLGSFGSGTYTLNARSVTPITQDQTPTQPVTVSNLPSQPEVFSKTHPNNEKWYSNNNPEFTWNLPSDVTKVSVLLHKNAAGNPGPISDGKIETKKYENIEDGIWYFHIKFGNEYGWGNILHRKVLIDTKAPGSFEIGYDSGGDAYNPRPTILFESEDETSGIDYYEITAGNRSATTSKASTKANPFEMFAIEPGDHKLTVKAVDMAGNSSSASIDISVEPIESPEITKIPSKIAVGELLTVEGKIDPNYKVELFIQKDYEEPVSIEVIPTTEGKFTITYDKALAKGDYLVWAQSKDDREARSLPTQMYSVEVGLPVLLQFGTIAIDYLTTMLTLVVLIFGIIGIAFYTWYRISVWRRRVRKETEEVSQTVAAAFRALKEEVEDQISMLDKKAGLTKSEKELRDRLQEALDTSEKFIGKEIKDIKKELE